MFTAYGCSPFEWCNPFSDRYNTDDEFRAFVRQRIDSGNPSRETVQAIISLTNLDGDEPEAKIARGLYEEFYGEELPVKPR